MPINFQQVAAPNFADANALLRLAADQREAAMKGLGSTLDAALGAAQNQNHAKMQQLVNQQSQDQLIDPVAREALAAQFASIASSTNNYDPLMMETYTDNRIDTLRGRDTKVHQNNILGIEGRQGLQTLNQTALDNEQTNKGYKFVNSERDRILGETVEKQNLEKAATVNYMFSNQLTGLDPVKDKDKIAALDARWGEALKQVYPNGMDEVTKARIAELSKTKEFGSKMDDLKYLTGMTNVKVAENNMKNNDAKVAILSEEQERKNVATAANIVNAEEAGNTKKQDKIANTNILNGIPADAVDAKGNINGITLNNDIVTKTNKRLVELTNPAGTQLFSKTLAEKRVKLEAGKNPIMTAKQIDSIHGYLQGYSKKDPNGVNASLTEKEKEVLFDMIVASPKSYDSWFSDSRKVAQFIPEYLSWYKKQYLPAETERIKAEQYALALEGVHKSGGDPITAIKNLGMTPGSENFYLLPQPYRDAIDVDRKDKRKIMVAAPFKAPQTKVKTPVVPGKSRNMTPKEIEENRKATLKAMGHWVAD